MASTLPFAHELLHRALPPDAAAQYHEERVIKRPLYLRPTSPEPSARALRRKALTEKKEKVKKRKALKPRPLSAAKKRELGLLEIPKEQVKWSIYVPLHNLWLGYMRDILGLTPEQGVEGRAPYVSPTNAGPVLVSADMHGALVEVVRSRCVSRVGLKGIVVRDSQHLFEIVTEGSKLKCKWSLPCELWIVWEGIWC
jgi:ribonuclease P protein subunit POP4